MNRTLNFLTAFFVGAFLTIAPLSLGVSAHAATSQTGGSPSGLTKVFTATTTDTVPSWASGAYVTMQGGGGGGQGLTTSGGGGGSGAAWDQIFTPVTPGATLTITVGAGGASNTAGGATSVTGTTAVLPIACGGNAGFSASGGVGGANPGCATSFVMSATGTFAAAPPFNFVPGQSGAASAGTLTCWSSGQSVAGHTGANGACSKFGAGGVGVDGAVGGNPATGYGAGGGGTNNGASAGGAGSPGFVMITYVP